MEVVVGRKGVEFRGVQKPALKAIMDQKSPIVVVMGIGGGKSLLFMVPARAMGLQGITVVIVPLVSVRGDLSRRCESVGIECVE
jgi:superfamily II DNA helicase RecQ